MPRFITLDTNDVVIAIRYGSTILNGEIKSDVGDIGQIMKPNGSFVIPETKPIVSQPTIEERIQLLEQAIDDIILNGGTF